MSSGCVIILCWLSSGCEGCNGYTYNTLCWLSNGCEGCNGCLVVVKVVIVVQYIMLVMMVFLTFYDLNS